MNEIPKTGEEARQLLADAERELADLNNALGTAVVDHALAVGRKDAKAIEKFNTVAQATQSKLPEAREKVTYLKDMSDRLAYAEARLARDQRVSRHKEIQPEAEKASKLLVSKRARVVEAARELIDASLSLRDTCRDTRELRSEYNALHAEFGNGNRIEWVGLDYWRIEVAPGLPMREALSGLRGRKRGERTNRAISPLKTIDSMSAKVRKAK
ncbi:hypothetical protein GKO46_13115 [SAR202 cluster bacterium JH702]|uniref:Uncharacterized protein n=1 Tax=Candidatus Lucifugimonas marina TaxID=3038979 RepID=A0ABD4XTP8_9CHLR|nr:hypothetical protein [SAR202 cluster bacterium JH702]